MPRSADDSSEWIHFPLSLSGVKTFQLGRGVRILASDPGGLIAFFKPAGILSHPNKRSDWKRSLLTTAYDLNGECYEVTGDSGKEPFRVWLINRLDSATSGVIISATRPAVAEAARAQFAEGKVSKRYFALVFGTISPRKQTWRDRLNVSREAGRLRTSSGAGITAETEVVLARAFPGRHAVSLIELNPVTGRTHQLRVQCAKRNLPIVGDQTYGNFGWNKDFAKATGLRRLFLHCAETGIELKVGGKEIRFLARSSLPKEFTP